VPILRRRESSPASVAPALLHSRAGHLAGLLALGTTCGNIYQGFSDCVLKLGENMATYEATDSVEPQGLRQKPQLQTVLTLYWDEFHACALAALWECQKEAAAVWEMLKRESRKIKFPGSLFELCSPGTAQSFAWTHVPNASILGIPLMLTWLNL
uniref:Neuritin 1 like n=1 Tax=Apteryx owenii TaxID=8824 RepID=A0A8B9P6D6_APTOW